MHDIATDNKRDCAVQILDVHVGAASREWRPERGADERLAASRDDSHFSHCRKEYEWSNIFPMIAQCFFLVKYRNACDSVYGKKVLSLCYFVFVRGFTRIYVI